MVAKSGEFLSDSDFGNALVMLLALVCGWGCFDV